MVPDNFSGQSSLKFFAGGALIKTIAPNDFNEFMKGRHETGDVGFIVDDSMIPGLADIDDLEVRDASSNVLVYRRTQEPTLARNIFRLGTHILPLWRLDKALKPKFRFWYDRIDQYSAETARNILSFHAYGSLYSSGRILYSNFDYYLYKHQKKVIVMQDPYEELAERLLVFNRLAPDENRLLNDRDATIFAPIIQVSRKLKTFDEAEFRSILGKTPPGDLVALSNPLTRQLTTATPDQLVTRGGVKTALTKLSEFDVVGTRETPSLFFDALEEILGIAPLELNSAPTPPKVKQVARSLRAVRWLEGLIEVDLEVYA